MIRLRRIDAENCLPLAGCETGNPPRKGGTEHREAGAKNNGIMARPGAIYGEHSIVTALLQKWNYSNTGIGDNPTDASYVLFFH